MRRLKIGLVLGGGGARGLAHIGVLKSLQEHNIPIDVIIGTSIGAIVGSAYAQNPDANLLEEKFHNFLSGNVFLSVGGVTFGRRRAYEPDDILQNISKQIKRRVAINVAANRQSILKDKRLKIAIDELLEDGNIENTKVPFACAAVDLISGQEIVFTSGDIKQLVQASSSIPGFLPPVVYDDLQLVDGSVCSNFSLEAAYNLGAEFIIVSNVSASHVESQPLDNVIDIIVRANTAATNKINSNILKRADFVFEPNVGEIVWNDFEHVDSIIEKGKEEAELRIENLNRSIKKESGFLGRLRRWLMKKFQITMNY